MKASLQRFKPLIDLFDSMDRAWDQVARQYKFQCNGCEDNCCHSLFFHHTHVEKAFLLQGFDTLSLKEQEAVLAHAREYVAVTFPDSGDPVSQKRPCPLLQDGRCRLYPFRPMICRMHGLPHELHRSGAGIFKGPGCPAGGFDTQPYHPFDRTPFYQEMARIEMAFRTRHQVFAPVRQTIAQILLNPV